MDRTRPLRTPLAASLCFAVMLFQTAAWAGSNELMDEHVRKKRSVTNAVIEELKHQGKLPSDGVIDYEARVVTPPGASKPVVKIDRLRVHSSQMGGGATDYIFGDEGKRSVDTALAPRSAPGASQKMAAPVPTDEKLAGKIQLKDGKALEEPAPAPAPAPEPPREKNFFERLFGL